MTEDEMTMKKPMQVTVVVAHWDEVKKRYWRNAEYTLAVTSLRVTEESTGMIEVEVAGFDEGHWREVS
jgi:hypothetical protein